MDELEAVRQARHHYKAEVTGGKEYAKPIYKALLKLEVRLEKAEAQNKRFDDWVDYIKNGKR